MWWSPKSCSLFAPVNKPSALSIWGHCSQRLCCMKCIDIKKSWPVPYLFITGVPALGAKKVYPLLPISAFPALEVTHSSLTTSRYLHCLHLLVLCPFQLERKNKKFVGWWCGWSAVMGCPPSAELVFGWLVLLLGLRRRGSLGWLVSRHKLFPL